MFRLKAKNMLAGEFCIPIRGKMIPEVNTDFGKRTKATGQVVSH
jgi:hypothetical protein